MSMVKERKRRGHNEGSIYRRADGRWTAAVTIGHQDGKARRKQFYGSSRKEVSDRLTEALRKMKEGLPLIGELQTVGQYLEDWLENSVKVSTRESTYTSYRQQVEQHIKPEIGHIRLARLSPQNVQHMLKRLLAKGQKPKGKVADMKPLSARTVSYCLVILRTALKRAEAFGLVTRNVARLVEPPRVERKEVVPINGDEARRFLELIKGDRLEALFRVGLALGLRRGEALALRWAEVDLEAATLRVSGSLQRLNRRLMIVPTKTRRSARLMSIPPSLLSVLREHRMRQLWERLKAGADWQDHDLVFCTSTGTPIEPRNVRRTLDRLMKDSGMRYFRLHDLRHFFASLLIAEGVELKVISELLGHSSLQITADVYAHVLPQVKSKAINMLDSVLSGGK